MKNFISIHKKSLIYMVLSLFLAVLLLFLARKISGFGEFYASNIFPFFPNTFGRLFSPIPFSIFEISLYALALFVVCFLGYVVLLLFSPRRRSRLKVLLPKSVLGLGCFLTTILLMLTLTCSINYSRNGFISDAKLIPAPSSRESLVILSELLIADLQGLTEEISLDEDGNFSINPDSVGEEAKEAMQQLGEKYPSLSGYYPTPKPVLLSAKMSDLNLTGIFSPYTIEANFNDDICDYVIPYTICHELAHLKGYIREDEAGFIGYLACSGSSSPALRYSAALSGLSYTLNALYRDSTPEEYQGVLRQVPQQALRDLQENRDYWQAHRSAISKLSNTANDTYLKANAQTDGVKSYGRMVDLLLAYYNIGAAEI